MFATKTIIATLALSTALVAQELAFDAATPATQDQQQGALTGSVDQTPDSTPTRTRSGPKSRPTSGPGTRLRRTLVDGTTWWQGTQAGTQTPDGSSGQVIIDDNNPYEGGIDVSEDLPLMLRPGVSISRCGVTVSNMGVSDSSILLSAKGAGCFTDIFVGNGVRAAIDVSAQAIGLEYLQVTVMGRAFLDVQGDQGLGNFDPRDLSATRAGIIIDGNGVTASDQEKLATITLKSSNNVVETMGASRDHEIRIEGASNLVRLHGADQVLSNGSDTRVMWMSPIFLQ